MGVYKPYNAKAKEGQIKVACVGDSITFGYGLLTGLPRIIQRNFKNT